YVLAIPDFVFLASVHGIKLPRAKAHIHDWHDAAVAVDEFNAYAFEDGKMTRSRIGVEIESAFGSWCGNRRRSHHEQSSLMKGGGIAANLAIRITEITAASELRRAPRTKPRH